MNPSVPAQSIKELVALVKASPQKYSYAAMGIGFGQLSAERLFRLGLKLDTLPRVPFNGAAPAINATLAGDTPILFMGLPPVAPYLGPGKLRALAVTSATRSPAYPQIPTLREEGIPNVESELLIGLVAPAGTPASVVALLQKQIADILALPDVKSTLAKFSFAPVGSPSAVCGKVMQEAHIPRN